MATQSKTPVSNDPAVPLADSTRPADAMNSDGTVNTDKAARAGAAERQAAGSADVGAPALVRQVEDGVVTDRRTGAKADKSLVGEALPVLRPNEPDPRQGVTTASLTHPGIPDGQDSVKVTFQRGYHLYNAGESASFSAAEADRLRQLGVAE